MKFKEYLRQLEGHHVDVDIYGSEDLGEPDKGACFIHGVLMVGDNFITVTPCGSESTITFRYRDIRSVATGMVDCDYQGQPTYDWDTLWKKSP